MMTRLIDELRKAVYATDEEAEVACTVFEELIASRFSTEVVYLWEFMSLADASCSDEFMDYGWLNEELRTALKNGDIYPYTSNRDYKWHINVPEPHILEVA